MPDDVCARCGAIADFAADGMVWCGPACLELYRRGVPCDPEEAPLRLEGRERIAAVDALLDSRLDAELDRLERQAEASVRDVLRRQELSRVTLPERDAYGRVVDMEGWLG